MSDEKKHKVSKDCDRPLMPSGDSLTRSDFNTSLGTPSKHAFLAYRVLNEESPPHTFKPIMPTSSSDSDSINESPDGKWRKKLTNTPTYASENAAQDDILRFGNMQRFPSQSLILSDYKNRLKTEQYDAAIQYEIEWFHSKNRKRSTEADMENVSTDTCDGTSRHAQDYDKHDWGSSGFVKSALPSRSAEGSYQPSATSSSSYDRCSGTNAAVQKQVESIVDCGSKTTSNPKGRNEYGSSEVGQSESMDVENPKKTCSGVPLDLTQFFPKAKRDILKDYQDKDEASYCSSDVYLKWLSELHDPETDSSDFEIVSTVPELEEIVDWSKHKDRPFPGAILRANKEHSNISPLTDGTGVPTPSSNEKDGASQLAALDYSMKALNLSLPDSQSRVECSTNMPRVGETEKEPIVKCPTLAARRNDNVDEVQRMKGRDQHLFSRYSSDKHSGKDVQDNSHGTCLASECDTSTKDDRENSSEQIGLIDNEKFSLKTVERPIQRFVSLDASEVVSYSPRRLKRDIRTRSADSKACLLPEKRSTYHSQKPECKGNDDSSKRKISQVFEGSFRENNPNSARPCKVFAQVGDTAESIPRRRHSEIATAPCHVSSENRKRRHSFYSSVTGQSEKKTRKSEDFGSEPDEYH